MSNATHVRHSYRYPTTEEEINETKIFISNEIPSNEEYIENQKVLELFVNLNYMPPSDLIMWLKLRVLTELTPNQAITMMRIIKRQSIAILEFQKNKNLPETGVLDDRLLRIAYPEKYVNCNYCKYLDDAISPSEKKLQTAQSVD
jgi:hypothetical protein